MLVKTLRVAMIVIDANEVAGDFLSRIQSESPSVHPVIWTLVKELADRHQVQLDVLYGSSRVSQVTPHMREGVSCVAIPPLFRRKSFMGAPMLARFLGFRKHLRQNHYDLVHGQGTEREAGFVAAFSNRPSLVTLHGNFSEISKIFGGPPWGYYSLASFLEKIVLRRIGGIICISKYVKDITAMYAKPQYLIHNPVREEFLAGSSRREGVSPPRVVYMGTFDDRKRPDMVLRICELAWQAGAKFVLGFYGGSGFGQEYQRKFQSACEPHILAGRVFFGGFAQEPWRIWSEAWVGLSASREESFGMNILEALAAGTPVIAPRIGGALDIVGDRGCGYLYDPSNLPAAAAALVQLLKDRVQWSFFSDAARKRAGEFGPGKIAEQTERAYFDAMNRSHMKR